MPLTPIVIGGFKQKRDVQFPLGALPLTGSVSKLLSGRNPQGNAPVTPHQSEAESQVPSRLCLLQPGSQCPRSLRSTTANLQISERHRHLEAAVVIVAQAMTAELGAARQGEEHEGPVDPVGISMMSVFGGCIHMVLVLSISLLDVQRDIHACFSYSRCGLARLLRRRLPRLRVSATSMCRPMLMQPALRGAMWYPCAQPPGEIVVGMTALRGVRDCPLSGSRLPLIAASGAGSPPTSRIMTQQRRLPVQSFVAVVVDHPGRYRLR